MLICPDKLGSLTEQAFEVMRTIPGAGAIIAAKNIGSVPHTVMPSPLRSSETKGNHNSHLKENEEQISRNPVYFWDAIWLARSGSVDVGIIADLYPASMMAYGPRGRYTICDYSTTTRPESSCASTEVEEAQPVPLWQGSTMTTRPLHIAFAIGQDDCIAGTEISTG
ncbi:hypothetical protein PILCRDRAFT_787210 [Piloderma croceum F 1598]|uniref:Uncharacterized protein n=1 Tax=Piloderma croceum (strain F 1598) TaxID=765440 RepID=A0A0C3FQR1_PILCF|nr:hypothetical protein PILCRDRAFT_787210 [Piloderma croceum F 1598]